MSTNDLNKAALDDACNRFAMALASRGRVETSEIIARKGKTLLVHETKKVYRTNK